MDRQDVVPQLIEDLNSTALQTRIKAVKHLRELQDSRAVQPLVKAALNYQGPYSEFEEIRDALLVFPEQAVPALVDAIKTGDVGYRGYAVQLLGYFKDDRALAPLLDVLDEVAEDTQPMVPHALAAYGEKVTDPLIERVQSHSNPNVRRSAMQTLSHITSTRVAHFAEQQLQDTVVQSRAINALGNPQTVIDMERRLNLIIPFLDSERPSTRLSAALALGKLRDERAVEALVAHLDDPDITTRMNIIAALGWIGSSGAVEPLINVLYTGSCRISAAMALGNIGDEGAVNALLSARETSNYPERCQINEALKKLGYLPEDYVHEPMTEQDRAEERRRTFNMTVSVLDHPNPENRAIYIQVLASLKDAKSVDILLSRLKIEDDLNVRLAIVCALRKIREAQNPETQKLIDETLQNFDPSSLEN